MSIIPVVLCGGSGTRLWPASREKTPKQFLSLMSEHSLIQETVMRALEISGAKSEEVVTVTLGAMREGVYEQLSALGEGAVKHILSEPMARDTAAAIAFAALYIEKNFGKDAIMWVLPSDHHIGDDEAMRSALQDAAQAARDDYLVTFGICPTRPETGYGYIRVGEKMGEKTTAHITDSFVEKPNRELAQQYLDDGRYLWNSGMFLFKAGRVIDQFEKHAEDVLKAVKISMRESLDQRQPSPVEYANIAKQPFDKAIMEKSRLVSVVPCDPEWSDIGSWESLWEIKDKDEKGNVGDKNAKFFDSENCLIHNKNRLVVCAGVRDIAVIEEDDAILVVARSNSDVIKSLVNSMKDEGRTEVAESVSQESKLGPQEYEIDSGDVMTLQGIEGENRFLTVLQGHVLVTTLQDQRNYGIGENVFIDGNMVYKIRNTSDDVLRLLDVRHTKPRDVSEQVDIVDSVKVKDAA
ncbi:MAG: sugar phosphate nucleotidyltransferase [Alphaproteobacteria bacterium]|nr:sugar phosphate nucleotidyltransferase [Alphaproteobacteria bacterium]